MLCTLIMAGGKGTRFWPLSTEEKPKQFLKLIGNRTMIQKTVDRVLPITPYANIYICTNIRYVEIIKEQLPEIPTTNIIVEPEGRNTTPCITLSTMLIKKRVGETNILVLPSDHLITDNNIFREKVLEANNFVDNNRDSIITFGMQPTRPETGYGYIKYIDKKALVAKVQAFVEKPNLENALKYIESEQYLWNSGMFLWNSEGILTEIQKYATETFDALKFVLENKSTDSLNDRIADAYIKTVDESIDYAVMEVSKNVYVIKGNFGWDDVGSWQALNRYKEKDQFGNMTIGSSIKVDGKNNMLISSKEEVFVNDLNNIYVIQNENRIFIGRRENLEEDVKKNRKEVKK